MKLIKKALLTIGIQREVVQMMPLISIGNENVILAEVVL